MTTNSPNPVDGDVQALIEHCQLRIKVLQNYWHANAEEMRLAKLDLRAYETTLASLTAEPLASTEKHEISNMQATGLYLRAWPVDREENERDGFNIHLYTTPPAQILRPVDLSECKKLWYDHDDLSAEIVCIPLKEIKKVLRQQGYEVKNEK